MSTIGISSFLMSTLIWEEGKEDCVLTYVILLLLLFFFFFVFVFVVFVFFFVFFS